jgi:SAM-dependent methyltransferase
MKLVNSVIKTYNQFSNIGKLLIILSLLLVVVVFFKTWMPSREGMVASSQQTIYKEGVDLYDDFYVDIYDHLVSNEIRSDFEIGSIIQSTKPTETSIIADIGCGTGNTVGELVDKKYQVLGIDQSPYMIKLAKEKYPSANFQVGNGLDRNLFNVNSLTHILCLYFTIYYMKDKEAFFNNCMDWLMPGGYLVVHLVDRETFDPILPPGNPLYIVSPQKYAKERITETKITFNDFTYSSKFNLDAPNDIATFDEKFKFNNGSYRKQQHKFYMEDTSHIVKTAQRCGFVLHSKIDMLKCAYENQYLYVFTKPN